MPAQSIIWLITVVALFALEAATVGLVCVWFGLGAICGLLISLFCSNIWIQLAVFLFVAAVCLIAVRPIVKRCLAPRGAATNADRVIGAEGIVTQTVDNLKSQGQISVRGAIWTARTEPNCPPLPEGTRVHVLRIEGVKVIVSPVQKTAAAQTP